MILAAALMCPLLGNPINGGVRIEGGQRTVNSVAIYSCARGFRVTDGSETRICQENLTWAGEEAVCNGEMMCQEDLTGEEAVCNGDHLKN